MSNKLPPRRDAMADRTFERTQGCWNCVHFDRSLAVKLWDECHRPEVQTTQLLTRLGDQEHGKPTGTMVDAVDKAIRTGRLGMCLKGKAPADFVEQEYLCPDGWNGRQGASLASAGRPDKEIGEIVEIAEARAKARE